MCTYTKTLAGTTPANHSIQSTKHRRGRQALEDEHGLAEALEDNLRRALESAKHRQERKALKVALALAELLADYLRRRMDCRRADFVGSETA